MWGQSKKVAAHKTGRESSAVSESPSTLILDFQPPEMWKNKCLIGILFCFVPGCTCGIQKFPVQGSNPHHSSNQSHCSENAGSLTHCTTRELLSVCCLSHVVFCYSKYKISVRNWLHKLHNIHRLHKLHNLLNIEALRRNWDRVTHNAMGKMPHLHCVIKNKLSLHV